ncbi:MAG: NAD(P)-dependent oxidoreductase, partial [Deltaproteobacteria bacterium]|nr:NAD(P)-dependent oxidoreductase [Deltaproteobacteria bacterium]
LLLPGEPDPGLGDARLIRGDVTEHESLAGLLAGHDAVVHLAALVGYGQRMDECLRVNRDGTRNIAAAALEAGARRFVQLSSVSVYGRAAGIPIDEEAPLQKTGDPYGDTKIDAERILGEHSRRGELDLTTLRPTVITGPGDDKFLGKVAENLRSGRARIIGRGDHAVDALCSPVSSPTRAPLAGPTTSPSRPIRPGTSSSPSSPRHSVSRPRATTCPIT